MKDYLIRIWKDYWAPAYRYGWWSVLFWVVVIILCAIMFYYDIHPTKAIVDYIVK